MNLIFIAASVILVGGTTFWLFSVLWRRKADNDSQLEHDGVNVAVLRDQWAELEQDHAHGVISASDLAEAKADLQRRALDEELSSKPGATATHGSKRAATVLAMVLPVAAILTYLYLGNPLAINPPPDQRGNAVTPADVQAMVASLEERLAQNPDDHSGWLMLARSRRFLGNHDEAVHAFAKLKGAIQTDPVALSEYADSLSRTQRSGFEGEPARMLERALSLDPNASMALTLAGAAAMQRGDYFAAITYWRRLLESLPAGSDAAQAVSEGIERAQVEQANAAHRLPD